MKKESGSVDRTKEDQEESERQIKNKLMVSGFEEVKSDERMIRAKRGHSEVIFWKSSGKWAEIDTGVKVKSNGHNKSSLFMMMEDSWEEPGPDIVVSPDDRSEYDLVDMFLDKGIIPIIKNAVIEASCNSEGIQVFYFRKSRSWKIKNPNLINDNVIEGASIDSLVNFLTS